MPLPADIAAGDIAILVAETDPMGTVTITVTGGQVWTAFTGSPITVASGSKLYVWWRRHIAGNTAPSVQATVDHVCAGCNAYSGCIASGDPIDVSETGTEAASDTSFQFITTISTTGADRLCVCICTSSADSNTGQFTVMTNAALSSLAEKMDYETTSGHGGGFAFDQGGRAAAGAMGTWAATLSAAWPKAYITFALKPPATIQFSGSAAGVSSTSVSPRVARKLTGAAAAVSTTNASPQVARKLTGSAAVTSVVSAVIALARRLAGSVAGVSSASGALTVEEGEVRVYFAGSASGALTMDGGVTLLRRLAGTAVAGSVVGAVIAVARRLTGQAAGVSDTAGAVLVGRHLSGSSIGTSRANGEIAVQRPLTGAAIVDSQANGEIAVERRFVGQAQAESNTSASSTVARRLGGSASAASETGLVLRIARLLSGATAAVSSVAAALHITEAGKVLLSGMATAVSSVSATLRIQRRLSGAAVATSAASAGLFVLRRLSGWAASGLTGILHVTQRGDSLIPDYQIVVRRSHHRRASRGTPKD